MRTSTTDRIAVIEYAKESFELTNQFYQQLDKARASVGGSASDLEVVKAAFKLIPKDDTGTLLQLAVYGRVVAQLHPRDLTDITVQLDPDRRQTFYSICTVLGKEKLKLSGGNR